MPDPDHQDPSRIIQAVVRGECERAELARIGIRISRYDDVWEVENPQGIFVEVAAEDVAHGFLQFKDCPAKLQSWAGLVLGSSSFIGLESLNSRPEGDELLGILWDAAFDGNCSERASLVARDIAQEE